MNNRPNELDEIVQARLELLEAGYPAQVLCRGKAPVVKEWQKRFQTNKEEIVLHRKSYPDATNTGLLTRTMPTLDVDVTDSEAVDSIRRLVSDRFSQSDDVFVRVGQHPKFAIPFRTDKPFPRISISLLDPIGRTHKIEWLGEGQQVIVAGIHPLTLAPYHWQYIGTDEPRTWPTPYCALPPIDKQSAADLVAAIRDMLIKEHAYRLVGTGERKKSDPPSWSKSEEARIKDALRHIPADDYDTWLHIGMALHWTGWGKCAWLIWDEWSRRSEKYDADNLNAKWNSFGREHLGGDVVTLGTLFKLATDHGYEPEPESDAQDRRPVEFTEEALALSFAETYASNLRYVAAWGRWFLFDGKRWRPDETLRAFDRARAICRKAAAECYTNTARAIASAKAVNAVVTLAKADRRLAATSDQWDTDPWLLNTPAGAVDLRTGQLRPHIPLDYMTKVTGITPDRGCKTPVWSQFLHRVTNGDRSLIAYLQRVAGYALTGITREHALFFAYGTGGNGKTTFINTIAKCVGNYHRTAPIETFTASRHERHPTDLAHLRGARLVTATETEEGRHWAESKIKTVTGGDTISARFMRQDFFDYRPQFKLLIAGNFKPGLRSVDEAIRRRLHLIPFAVTIPPEERDNELEDRLEGELPGILAWMIDGCLAWQKEGLNPPEVVISATNNYLEAEDVFAAWMDERCEADQQAWETSSALFSDWLAYANNAGEEPGSRRRFAERLTARGFQSKKNNNRGFSGLRLRTPPA
jgi:putative DNA primase/helicase